MHQNIPWCRPGGPAGQGDQLAPAQVNKSCEAKHALSTQGHKEQGELTLPVDTETGTWKLTSVPPKSTFYKSFWNVRCQ